MDNYLSNVESRIKKYFITLNRVEKLKAELQVVEENYEKLKQIRNTYKSQNKETSTIDDAIYRSKNEILSMEEKISEASVGYKLLEVAISGLDNEDMELIRLRYVKNFNYEKIAQNLYTSKSTVFRKNKKIILKIAENLN